MKVKVRFCRGRKIFFNIGLEFVLGIIVLVTFVILAAFLIASRFAGLDGRIREYYIAVEERCIFGFSAWKACVNVLTYRNVGMHPAQICVCIVPLDF